MFDEDNILKSPRAAAQDRDASEPLRLVLEDPNRRRWTKLLVTTLICLAFVVLDFFVIWIWAYRTQKNNPGFWHVSLVSLLFWLSVSQGLVALSALLRVTHASWRYPLNRMLDIASLFGLWVPALLPFLVVVRQQIYDLGVSDLQDNVWRVSGPIWWDAFAIGTAYVAGWMLLYLTSLPDFAMLRDRAPEGPGSRLWGKKLLFFHLPTQKAVYRWAASWPVLQRVDGRLAWGRAAWTGAEHQWRVLRRAEGVLIVGVLTSFVGSQTVLGWDFQLAAARNWDSSIFAPLFTIGSLLGAAALGTLLMTQISRLLRGRGFITRQHYDNLGRLMIAFGLVWFYFRWCDYLTAWYGRIPDEWDIQQHRGGLFPTLTVLMVFGCFVAPVFGNMIHKFRTSIWGLCIISVFVLIGLASQRYLDTVPTFAQKYPAHALLPTVPSLLVFLGLAAMFVLTYLLAARYFPIMSWWGTGKERTRTGERQLGNTTVTVMVEDPPVWET